MTDQREQSNATGRPLLLRLWFIAVDGGGAD
jgi:hypothetical protein